MSEEAKGGSAVLDAAAKSGAEKAADHVVDRVLGKGFDFLSGAVGKVSVITGGVFTSYLKNAYARYNQVKTLAAKNVPRSIIGNDNIYVHVGVLHEERAVSIDTANDLLRISQNILITGTGGAGKSMLMRYLFLNTVNRGEYIPILVELRRLGGDDCTCESIMKTALHCMREFDANLSEEQFLFSLRQGNYLFLLDGLDEVGEDIANKVAHSIQKFCAKYPQNACIVTSRLDRNFAPLETFTAVEAMMLSKEQAVSLAQKLRIDDEKTAEFCRQLEDELFEKQKDFAENPLLLTMMLLTFMNNNSIPDHLADFYQKAYEALYNNHDNLKGMYRREFKCGDINEGTFKQILAHFCFHTLFESCYEFERGVLLERLTVSIQKVGAHVAAEDYLDDLKNVVCLLVLEGRCFRFAHRSFQEYFAAYYVSTTLSDSQQQELFYKLLGQDSILYHDGFFALLFQLEPERFCPNVLERRAREFYEKNERCAASDVKFYRTQYAGISIIGSETSHGICHEVGDMKFVTLLYLFRRFLWGESRQINMGDKSLKKGLIPGVQAVYQRLHGERTRRDGQLSYYIEFSEFDESQLFSDGEKKEFYARLVDGLGMRKEYAAMGRWLKEQDEKRKALAAEQDFPDFLNSL